DRLVEGSARQATDDLCASGVVQVAGSEQLATARPLANGDERQLISVANAADEVSLLKGKAEQRTLNAAHDRHLAVVQRDEVIAADESRHDDEQPDYDNGETRGGDDDEPPPPTPRWWLLGRLRWWRGELLLWCAWAWRCGGHRHRGARHRRGRGHRPGRRG